MNHKQKKRRGKQNCDKRMVNNNKQWQILLVKIWEPMTYTGTWTHFGMSWTVKICGCIYHIKLWIPTSKYVYYKFDRKQSFGTMKGHMEILLNIHSRGEDPILPTVKNPLCNIWYTLKKNFLQGKIFMNTNNILSMCTSVDLTWLNDQNLHCLQCTTIHSEHQTRLLPSHCHWYALIPALLTTGKIWQSGKRNCRHHLKCGTIIPCMLQNRKNKSRAIIVILRSR